MMTPPSSSRPPRAQRDGRRLLTLGLAALLASAACSAFAAEKKKKRPAESAAPAETVHPIVTVVDGVVQPRRPVMDAVADAIQFLRKGDGAYVPGRIDGELAGYFMSALVQADGSRVTSRQLSFPARHHAYFIRTFLHYYTYTGEREWLQRARDLADWNIAHSTPADAAYANLPYSAHQDGKPTGSADKNSIEPDKGAFLGTQYLALFDATGDVRYRDAARKIAATLLPRQHEDGSWSFRVIPGDGKVYQEFGGAPVFYVEFFESLNAHEARSEYVRAADQARRLMIARNVEAGEWGTYHEDIAPKDGTHLSAEPMCFTADYLLTHAEAHPEYVAMGKKVLAQMEAKLVFTEGHAAAPAPAVAEQATFAHIMAGHTARYCLALADLYRDTHEPAVRKRALSGIHALTYMQSDAGLFRTHFWDTKKKEEKDPATANNWYSQHLYTICHVLECMRVLPEIAPEGQDHIIANSEALRDVAYAKRSVKYAASRPATVMLKLSFAPKSVQLGGRELAPSANGEGWSYDSATHVLAIRHGSGQISVQ